MCKLCNQVPCPETCPSYGLFPPAYSSRPRRFCKICLREIPHGDVAYRSGKKVVCFNCAEEIDISDLMRICETENRRQLIFMLGFVSD